MTARRRLGPGYLAQNPTTPMPDEHARLLPAERVASAEPDTAADVPVAPTGRRRLGPGYLATVDGPAAQA
ncbi:hypothetical protein ACIQF6_34205 [Kitasatospora sp. NPDC092948]|uniref:hypothetical protein n=1 Tax=Kitasatospora sp. NPDC092948 TaxID=3364088 RepID=UPI0038137175